MGLRLRFVVIFFVKLGLPSGHMTLEHRRNLVEIKSLRCSKLNFDVVPMPMCSARWVGSVIHVLKLIDRLNKILYIICDIKMKFLTKLIVLKCILFWIQCIYRILVNDLFKVSGPRVQTFCIEKDSYMDAI